MEVQQQQEEATALLQRIIHMEVRMITILLDNSSNHKDMDMNLEDMQRLVLRLLHIILHSNNTNHRRIWGVRRLVLLLSDHSSNIRLLGGSLLVGGVGGRFKPGNLILNCGGMLFEKA